MEVRKWREALSTSLVWVSQLWVAWCQIFKRHLQTGKSSRLPDQQAHAHWHQSSLSPNTNAHAHGHMFTHIQNLSDSVTHTHTGRAKESERLAMCLPWDPSYSPAVGDQWSVQSLSLEQPEAHSSLVQSCISQRGRAVSLGRLAHATFYYRGLSPWHKHPLSPVGWPRPASFRCRALGFTVSFAFLPTS